MKKEKMKKDPIIEGAENPRTARSKNSKNRGREPRGYPQGEI